MGYLVQICRSEYSAIDPNVVHDYEEFRDNKHIVVSPRHTLAQSTLFERYGAIVPINMPLYLTSHIQTDFGFARMPHIKESSLSYVTFTDGEKTLTFPKSKLKQYTRIEKRDMYVVFIEKLFSFDDKDLFFELIDYFEKIVGIEVKPNHLYRLHCLQADTICQYYPNAWSLEDLYNEDDHCLYVRFLQTEGDDGGDSDSPSASMERDVTFYRKDENELTR